MSKAEPSSLPGPCGADEAIVGVKALGFVDLEGAKTKAILVEYALPLDSAGIGPDTYAVTNYTLLQVRENGFARAVEMDYDGISGNEGAIERIYVNDRPELSPEGGKRFGRYVVIEVNTAYMLSGQNLSYTASLIAGGRERTAPAGGPDAVRAYPRTGTPPVPPDRAAAEHVSRGRQAGDLL